MRRGLQLLVCAGLIVGAKAASAGAGESELALPGLLGVELAQTGRTGLAVAARAGYGFTESVLGTGDNHHRVAGSLAITLRPIEHLGFGLRFDGRYDRHVNGPSGSDDGLVGDPRVFVRYARPVNEQWSLGGQALIWFPGGDEPPSIAFSATTPEILGLLSFQARGSPLIAAANLGFRLDRSARAVDAAVALSPEDRLALGLTEAPTLLLGAGLAYNVLPRLAVLADLDADLLFGGSAPPLSSSPLIARLGTRYELSQDGSWSLEGRVEAHLLGRADASDNLGPVPPRFGFAFGLNYAPPAPARAPTPLLADPSPPMPVAVAPPPPLPTAGALRVKVTRRSKSPLSGAEVSVDAAAAERADAEGVVLFEGLTPGRVALSVSHPGYETVEITSTIVAGQLADLELSLRPDLPSGTVQGRIRNPKGKPVAGAKVTIAPLGLELDTDRDGRFEVSLPPGPYTVSIAARGLRGQSRKINVERDEVVILNADLLRP